MLLCDDLKIMPAWCWRVARLLAIGGRESWLLGEEVPDFILIDPETGFVDVLAQAQELAAGYFDHDDFLHVQSAKFREEQNQRRIQWD